MLNFDQTKVEALELQNTGKIDLNIERAAKTWNNLYDPDYRLLFNPIVLPIEMFKG